MSDKKYFIVGNITETNLPLYDAINQLQLKLKNQGDIIQIAYSYKNATNYITSNAAIDCMLVEWNPENSAEIIEFLKETRIRHEKVPVFLLVGSHADNAAIDSHVIRLISETFIILDDTIDFMIGRLSAAIARYEKAILPPLMAAMMEYAKLKEYSWSAPGHQGGIGFCKTPVGRKFFDFYGENLFRTDMGIERTSLGSMLDHTGAFGESEKYVARVFGADRSYSLVGGSSESNRTIMQACCVEDDTVVCDRNCHKSIEQGLILTGANPVYMIPTRNAYGIIGPIPKAQMEHPAVQKKIQDSPLVSDKNKKPAYAVVTNCTYDGLVYNGNEIQRLLGASTDRLHYDEAWFGYSRFHPMYKDYHAMRGDKNDHGKDQPTLFATHSTHKLLNALSQGSFIHMREGRNSIDEACFSQSYMLHATTSPLYSIAASNDVAAAMMDGDQGQTLISEVIEEAIHFRQHVAQMHKECNDADDWFFKPWNPEEVTDPRSGQTYRFEDAPMSLLANEQSCWKLRPGEAWHGFNDVDENWVMLDPVKVSILAPGLNEDGSLAEHGVPAALVTAYLSSLGIVPTRTTDFQIMFLFSMGVTKGKWVTLMNSLTAFKKYYDSNALLDDVLPDLVAQDRKMYAGVGLKDLGQRMFSFLKEKNPNAKLNQAYSTLPTAKIRPRQAFSQMVTKHVEMVSIFDLKGRIAANAVIPYPPGIPMLLSGENFGDDNSPQIGYMKALQEWDDTFPGFEHETEGTEKIDGIYHILCVKK